MTHRFFYSSRFFFSSTLKALFFRGKGKGESRETGLLFMHFLLFLFNKKSKVIKVRLENINFHFEKGTASEENPR